MPVRGLVILRREGVVGKRDGGCREVVCLEVGTAEQDRLAGLLAVIHPPVDERHFGLDGLGRVVNCPGFVAERGLLDPEVGEHWLVGHHPQERSAGVGPDPGAPPGARQHEHVPRRPGEPLVALLDLAAPFHHVVRLARRGELVRNLVPAVDAHVTGEEVRDGRGIAEPEPFGKVKGNESGPRALVERPVAFGNEDVARNVRLALLKVVGGGPVERAVRIGGVKGRRHQAGGGTHGCFSRGALRFMGRCGPGARRPAWSVAIRRRRRGRRGCGLPPRWSTRRPPSWRRVPRRIRWGRGSRWIG